MSSYPENPPEIDKYYDLIINDNTNSINAMLKSFVLREAIYVPRFINYEVKQETKWKRNNKVVK